MAAHQAKATGRTGSTNQAAQIKQHRSWGRGLIPYDVQTHAQQTVAGLLDMGIETRRRKKLVRIKAEIEATKYAIAARCHRQPRPPPVESPAEAVAGRSRCQLRPLPEEAINGVQIPRKRRARTGWEHMEWNRETLSERDLHLRYALLRYCLATESRIHQGKRAEEAAGSPRQLWMLFVAHRLLPLEQA